MPARASNFEASDRFCFLRWAFLPWKALGRREPIFLVARRQENPED